MSGLKLELNPAKTQIVNIRDGLDFLGVHFEGDRYTYLAEERRIVIEHDHPEWFHYDPEVDY